MVCIPINVCTHKHRHTHTHSSTHLSCSIYHHLRCGPRSDCASPNCAGPAGGREGLPSQPERDTMHTVHTCTLQLRTKRLQLKITIHTNVHIGGLMKRHILDNPQCTLKYSAYLKTSEWLGSIMYNLSGNNSSQSSLPVHTNWPALFCNHHSLMKTHGLGSKRLCFGPLSVPQKTIGWSCFQRDCTQCILLHRPLTIFTIPPVWPARPYTRAPERATTERKEGLASQTRPGTETLTFTNPSLAPLPTAGAFISRA